MYRNLCRGDMEIDLENMQSDNTVDAITSSNKETHEVIAVGVENASEVPIVLSDFNVSVLQEVNSGITSSLPRPKKLKTMQSRRLDSYIDYISDQQKAGINDALAKFFYGCNVPLKMVESKLFLSFISAIRPAYTPPSIKAMSNEILHNLYTEFGKYRSTFSHSEGILIIQRTEIKQTSYVIGFVQSQEKVIYLKTWNIQEESNLSLLTVEAITLASTKFKMMIYAVISNEIAFQLLINTDEYSNLWILQCNISFVASIEKELVNLELVEKVRYLLEQFSSKELENDLITRGGIAVVLEDNSFYYNRDLFFTCLKNLRAMTQMIGNRQYKLKKEVINILLDESFEEELNRSLDLIKPVCNIAEKCEKSKITIADAAEDWLMLASIENVYHNLQSQIDTILTPIALVANLLHPIYRGQRFANDQDRMRKVMEFLIDHLDEEGMNDFGKYKKSTEIFNSRRLRGYTDGQTFWQAVAPIHPKLSSFAIKILQLPAAVPKLKFYPNNLNDLTPKRFEKLTNLFYHLNM